MEIHVIHKEIAWLFVIDDYDYIPGQEETGPKYDSGGEPGFPESVEINEYHLELYSHPYNSHLVPMINAQLSESDKLSSRILKIYDDIIHEELLEMHLEEN